MHTRCRKYFGEGSSLFISHYKTCSLFIWPSYSVIRQEILVLYGGFRFVLLFFVFLFLGKNIKIALLEIACVLNCPNKDLRGFRVLARKAGIR